MIGTLFHPILNEWRRRRNPVGFARSLGVRIGEGCRLIGRVSFGSEPYLIEIGNHVSITDSMFITHDGGAWVLRDQMPDADLVGRIIVGNNVFIGARVIILPGVTIGDNSVIGAGAVVTKPIPAGSVAVGCPARRIRDIDEYRSKVHDMMLPTARLDQAEKEQYLRAHFGIR